MEKLTKEDALKSIQKIKDSAGDYEQAHSLEDSLLWKFIKCLSNGLYDKNEAKEIASIILTSQDIEFGRYCA